MKDFKIGEYAIGGIIRVTINEEDVTIVPLDWDSKKPVRAEETSDDESYLWNVLFDLTSSYYAEQIMEYIKSEMQKKGAW